MIKTALRNFCFKTLSSASGTVLAGLPCTMFFKKFATISHVNPNHAIAANNDNTT